MGQVLSCLQKPHDHKKKKYEQKPRNAKHKVLTPNQYLEWEKQLGITEDCKIIKFGYPSSIQHNSFKQIEKDIDRTFPEAEFFKDEEKKEQFSALLKKFAVYFPKTGYTQGLNFLVGYVLMSGFEPNEAFAIVCKICTHHNMMCLGLYQDQFPLIRLYCAIFWEILNDCRQELTKKIKQLGIPDELWIFQWFMTFFIYSIPLYLVRDLLSFFITHKGMSMPKLAYAIVIELQQQIMQCSHEIHFLELTEKLKRKDFCEKHLNIDQILSTAKLFSEEEMKVYLKRVPLVNNTYVSYFNLEENDRKMKNVEILNQFHEERKEFLKEPTSMRFSRNMTDISMLDSLESISIQKLYHSLMNNKLKIPSQSSADFEQASTRMWTSDLMHLQAKKQQKSKENKQPIFSAQDPSIFQQTQSSIVQHPQSSNFRKKK